MSLFEDKIKAASKSANSIGNTIGGSINNLKQSIQNTKDSRLTEVENEKKAALDESNNTYDQAISGADKFYGDQIQASKDWETTQSQLQQEQTDFTIQQIEQQKEQSQKDYEEEQSAAYVDWKKQSNPYGANAEQMAASGLTGSGFSESSQVAMYTAYQNRVSIARASFEFTKQEFNNAIQEAQLQNSSLLAEIAYKAQQEQIELNMQRYMNAQTLVLEKLKAKMEIDQVYYSRYQDVLKQINTEKALAEEQRQFDATLAEEQRQFDKKTGDYYLDESEQTAEGTQLKNSTKGQANNDMTDVLMIPDAVMYGPAKAIYNQYMEAQPQITQKTQDSVAALGFGNIDGKTLETLVSNGVVEKYTEDGVVMYKLSKLFKNNELSNFMHEQLKKAIASGVYKG